MLKYVLLVLIFCLLAVAAVVRVRPLDMASYHVDPETIALAGRQGQFSVAESGDIPPVTVDLAQDDVAQKLQEHIRRAERTELAAGRLEDGLASYVTRSKIWGFPDVTTIKLEPVDGGTRITMIGRLVYGKSDFGVNEARVRDWLTAISD